MDKVKIWRSARKAFDENLGPSWKWIVLISLPAIPIQFLCIRSTISWFMGQIWPVLQNGQIEQLQGIQIPPAIDRLNEINSWVLTLTSIVAFYIFTTLVLAKDPLEQPVAEGPQLSLQNFLGWLKNLSPLLAVYCLPLILDLFQPPGSADPNSGSLDTLISFLTVMGYMVFVRFSAASPLAISGAASSLKTSWQLTRSNWWRITWNFIVYLAAVGSLIAVILIAIVAAAALIGSVFGQIQAFLILALAVASGLSFSVSCLAFAAFTALVCRILDQEKQHGPVTAGI